MKREVSMSQTNKVDRSKSDVMRETRSPEGEKPPMTISISLPDALRDFLEEEMQESVTDDPALNQVEVEES